jgi:hypothetical protein
VEEIDTGITTMRRISLLCSYGVVSTKAMNRAAPAMKHMRVTVTQYSIGRSLCFTTKPPDETEPRLRMNHKLTRAPTTATHMSTNATWVTARSPLHELEMRIASRHFSPPFQ